MDWKQQVTLGEYMMFEAYKILDPNMYTEIYNDRYLKRYLTALIKKQWGANMSKFDGVALPFGGSYRLVDFVLSNLVNAGFLRIAVLTQYKSHSLDRHITTTWRMCC